MLMSDKIQNKIHKVLNDGGRTAKYRLYVTSPIGEAAAGSDGATKLNELDVICKSASFPGRSTDVIELKHKGKSIPIPGQEKYDQTFELTFYLDEEHESRILFDKWFDRYHMDDFKGINSKTSLTNNGVEDSLMVNQLNYEMDQEIVSFIFFNVFPISISDISLDASEVANVGEFTVTFAYSHYMVQNIRSGYNADEIAEKIGSAIQGALNKGVKALFGAIGESEFAKSANAAAGKANKSATDAINDFENWAG
jgi:hypothetical protein